MTTYENVIFSEKNDDGTYRVGLGQLDTIRRSGIYLSQSVYLKEIDNHLRIGVYAEISQPRRTPDMDHDSFVKRTNVIDHSRVIGKLSDFKVDQCIAPNPTETVPIATATFTPRFRYVDMISRLHELGDLQFGLRGYGGLSFSNQSDTGTVTTIDKMVTWDLITSYTYKLSEIIKQ